MFERILKKFIPKTETPAKKREFVGRFAGVSGIVLNTLLCVFKVIAGVLSGSVSIIADAVNNLADALSSAIAIFSFKLSGKPADKDHPYGHERIEYVVTLFLAFLIIFIGYELIKTSVGRIVNPGATRLSVVAIVVLVAAIGVKLMMNRMYACYAKMIDSTVLKATAQDALNDVIATSAILLSNIASAITHISLDGYVGLGASLLIIWSGIILIKDATDPILGTAPDRELVDGIRKTVLSYDGVIGIHDLMVHSYGPNKTFASVHVEVDAHGDILVSHDIIDNIEREVSAAMGVELIIHMDPIVTGDEKTEYAKKCVLEVVKNIDSVLTIHDFRTVPGNTHTNLIFDVVLPFNFEPTQKEMSTIIENEVKNKMGKEYFCVINFDMDYMGN